MQQIRQQLGIGAWNGSGALYGTRAQVREAKRLLKAALRGKVDRLQFVDDRLLGLMQRLAEPLALVSRWDLSRIVKVLVPVYGLLEGRADGRHDGERLLAEEDAAAGLAGPRSRSAAVCCGAARCCRTPARTLKP